MAARKAHGSKTGAARTSKQAGAKKAGPKQAGVKTSAAASGTAPAGPRPTKAGAARGSPLARVRAICLAFPEAHEVEAWGEPTFRVKNKLFAMHSSSDTHHGAGREGIWINSDRVTQDLLLRAKPDRYFKPPYVGPSGWIGAWLDGKPDWAELTELLREGYRRRAPKKLAARLDDA